MLWTFPQAFIPPNGLLWMPDMVADQQRAVNGRLTASLTDGGGGWLARLTIPLLTPDKVRTALVILSRSQQGAMPFILPSLPIFAPWPLGRAPADVPHSDGASFSDGSLYATGGINIVLAAATAARATSIRVTPVVAAALRGAEHFGVDYPTEGRHMHQVDGIENLDGGDLQLTISPPWREDMPVGAALDFAAPSCTVTLTNVKEAMSLIKRPVKSDLTLVCEEYFA